MMQLGLQPGTVIDNEFEIVRLLSEGGMGAVYVVQQRSTRTLRALKVMLPALAANAELREKFIREATVGSRIASAHVVQVIQAGVEPSTNTPWLVMELLEGEDLERFVTRGLPASDFAIQLLRQLGFALAAAHAVGVVHRDLKPENIFLAQTGREHAPPMVKILDFGIAKVVSESKTNASMAIGSPLWMAPEQASAGQAVTPATDVWSFGLLAFYVLTGHSYWHAARADGASAVQILKEICFDAMPAASLRATELRAHGPLPHGFDHWFARCTARDPTARIRDGGEASRELEAVLQGRAQLAMQSSTAPEVYQGPSSLPLDIARPSRRNLWLFVGGAAALLGTATVAGGLLLRTRPRPVAAEDDAVTESVAGRIDELYEDGRDAKNAVTAVERARKACDGGDRDACAIAADATIRGRGAPVSVESGVARLNELCAAKSMLACAFLASALVDGPGVTRDNDRAAKLAQAACDAGVMRGCKVLGDAYQNGLGVTADPKRATELYRKACDGGNPRGCNNLGVAYLSGDGVVRDPSRAVELYDRACRVGLQPACMNLGGVMLEGIGVSADPKRSAELFDVACKAGVTEACRRLASLRLTGRGVAKDVAEALRLHLVACDAGDSMGCNEAGLGYEYGQGTQVDEKRSTELYQRACNGKLPLGCTNLGYAYLQGRGTPKDGRRAAELLKAACDENELLGCAGLSIVYATGEGVAADPKHAFALAKRACDGKEPRGCGTLSALYLAGLGVARDPAKAAQLAEWACERRDGGACINVAEQYERGTGVKQDKARAGAFYARACELGSQDACVR